MDVGRRPLQHGAVQLAAELEVRRIAGRQYAKARSSVGDSIRMNASRRSRIFCHDPRLRRAPRRWRKTERSPLVGPSGERCVRTDGRTRDIPPGVPGAETSTPVIVDAVIVAYNSRDILHACVEPLADLPWVDVIVVDNASPDDSAAAVADLPDRHHQGTAKRRIRVRLQRRDRRRHGGVRAAPESRRKDRASEPEDAHRRVRARSSPRGRGTTDNRRRRPLALTQRRFPRLRSTYSQALGLHHLAPAASWAGEVIRNRAPTRGRRRRNGSRAGCVLLRRTALEDVGGLDEGFFLYSEETDLFRRLSRRGWEPGFEPQATAYHKCNGSAPRDATAANLGRKAASVTRANTTVRWSAFWRRSVWRLDALVRAAAWARRPARRRGHLAAARAALGRRSPARRRPMRSGGRRGALRRGAGARATGIRRAGRLRRAVSPVPVEKFAPLEERPRRLAQAPRRRRPRTAISRAPPQ